MPCVRLVADWTASHTCSGITSLPYSTKELSRVNAGRHGNDSVPYKYQYGSNQTPKCAGGSHVAVTDSSNGHDCPVHRHRYACEFVFWSFNEIHNCAKDRNHRHYGQKKTRILRPVRINAAKKVPPSYTYSIFCRILARPATVSRPNTTRNQRSRKLFSAVAAVG